MCQFHSGTMDRPNPWRVIGLPRGCYHSNPITCCRSSPSVGCHASNGSCLRGNSIACCHETEMLRHFAGSWPPWTPVPVPAANTFVATAGYRRNGTAGCRSNIARKSTTSFSISAILGGGPSSSDDPKRKEDQTTKTVIIRPWDDEVSSDPSSSSREWRKSEDDADEEDMEADHDDDDDQEEEEEIDVGGSGQIESLGKSSSNCPLDALLRMTSQTRFLHQRISTQTTTTSTTTIDYTSDGTHSLTHSLVQSIKSINQINQINHSLSLSLDCWSCHIYGTTFRPIILGGLHLWYQDNILRTKSPPDNLPRKISAVHS